MRRARAQAASAASAASSSALRPLIFVVVSLFLVLPMLIYNFATLDEAQIRRWTESVNGAAAGAWLRREDLDSITIDDALAITALPPSLRHCAAVSRANLSSSETVAALRDACFDADDLQPASDMVHFVYLPVQMVPLLKGEPRPRPENFTIAQFAAVQSVRKHAKPSLMVLHYPATEPRAYWYTQCQRHLSLHRVLFPALPTAKPSSLNVFQRRDVMQLLMALRALRLQGGIAFTDFNTLVLRPTRLLRQLPFAMGRSHGGKFAVSTAMLSARAGNAHVSFLETALLTMLENDDLRLRDRPLDQLVGELLLESVAVNARGGAKPNVVLASPEMLDALRDPHVQQLVRNKPTDQSTRSLREALAIHLPQASAATASAKGFDEMTQLVQSRTTNFETLAQDPTLLSAVLRFAISLNETSELDTVL